MSENASERTRRLRPVVAASLVGAILLVAAYVASVVAYRSSIQGDFTPPQTRPDTVAVVFVPLDIDTIAKEITAEVLIFPGQQLLTIDGRLDRAGGTVTIALIFIILMVMFGVLAVITVVAGWRGRLELTISTAAWLTSSVFALIALRNALPGHPPLGSWMDVLAYFWVIATIMVMIGVTVVSLVVSKPEES